MVDTKTLLKKVQKDLIKNKFNTQLNGTNSKDKMKKKNITKDFPVFLSQCFRLFLSLIEHQHRSENWRENRKVLFTSCDSFDVILFCINITSSDEDIKLNAM